MEKIKVIIPKSQLWFSSLNYLSKRNTTPSCILGHVGKAIAIDDIDFWDYPVQLICDGLVKIHNQKLENFLIANQPSFYEVFDSAFEKEIINRYPDSYTAAYSVKKSFIDSLSIEEIRTLAAHAVKMLSPFFDIEFIDA